MKYVIHDMNTRKLMMELIKISAYSIRERSLLKTKLSANFGKGPRNAYDCFITH